MIRYLKKYFSQNYIDVVTTIILLGLPYMVFNGRLFIGGDDSRLFYLYPEQFLRHLNLSGWFNFSDGGSYNPNFFLVPLLLCIYLVKLILVSVTLTSYLFFSLPLIAGYFSFKKLAKYILLKGKNEHSLPLSLGAITYTFSPILLAGLLGHFLYAVWLLPLLPLLLYFILIYIKTGSLKYLLGGSLFSIILSLALYSIPWLVGAMMPMVGAFIFMVLIRKVRVSLVIVKRSALFVFVIVVTQAFWLLPFAYSFLPSKGSSSYIGNTLTTETANTFEVTVLATSKGTILYPMLNLFHRQIAFDFKWPLADVYSGYYDKVFLLSTIYLVVFALGTWLLRKTLSKHEHTWFIYLIIAMLIALFLFTVNIGTLKYVFLSFGRIPGFAMFRNGYDKFAPGYVLFYSLVITVCLTSIGRAAAMGILPRRIKLFIFAALPVIVLLNFIPAKKLIDRRLWKTQDTGTTIRIPQEYLNFMEQVEGRVPITESILSLPFSITNYTTIKDPNRNAVFTGRSPVQIFSGIKDYSGTMSFAPEVGKDVENYIQSRDYEKLLSFLKSYNIHYAFETTNIPQSVLDSYLYSAPIINKLDDEFREKMYDSLVIESSEKNYKLYKLKTGIPDTQIISAANQFYKLDVDVTKNVYSSLQTLYSPTLPLLPKSADIPQGIHVKLLDSKNPIKLTDENYTLHFAENNLASISVESDKLILDKGINLQLNESQIIQSNKTEITDFTKDYVFEESSTFQDYDQLKDHPYTVSHYDKISTYRSSSNNLVEDIVEISKNWKRGDCYRYDDFGETTVSLEDEDQEKVLKIASNEEHNTCIWRSIKFKKDRVYKMELDYKTLSESLALVFADENAAVAKRLELQTTGKNTWKKFKGFYVPSKDHDGLFMLYSGRSKDGSVTTYKNIELNEYVHSADITLEDKFNELSNIDTTLPTEKDGTLTVVPRVADLSDAVQPFIGWSKVDCAAINNEPSVEFKIGDDNSITLTARKNHNACINKKIEINSNDVYRLKVDYEKFQENNISVYIDFGEDFGYKKYDLGNNNKFDELIRPPTGAEFMTIVLYSGSSGQSSSVKYKSIEMSSYSKQYENNAAVENTSILDPPVVTSIDRKANHLYTAKVNNIKGNNFILLLNDSYHSGWSARTVKGDISIEKHFLANGFSNGWYIDINKVCANEGVCNKLPDGSNEIDIVVEFKPQRWFYYGVVISISTVIILTGAMMTSKIRSRRYSTYKIK